MNLKINKHNCACILSDTSVLLHGQANTNTKQSVQPYSDSLRACRSGVRTRVGQEVFCSTYPSIPALCIGALAGGLSSRNAALTFQSHLVKLPLCASYDMLWDDLYLYQMNQSVVD